MIGSALQAIAANAASDLHDLQATRERPLFSPTRRPPLPLAADDAPDAPLPVIAPGPDVEVSGIIIGGERRVAIVKRRRDAAATSVSIGDRIDGWTVSAIDQRAIVLRLGSRDMSVAMPDPGR